MLFKFSQYNLNVASALFLVAFSAKSKMSRKKEIL